jgi:hypothetical protein
MSQRKPFAFILLLLLLPLAGSACTGPERPELAPVGQPQPPNHRVETIVLSQDRVCSGRFVAHDLPHRTASAVERVGFFTSNGSGLAINDLDNDGRLDLILGNIFGPNPIFWNEAAGQFTPQVLVEDSLRAITPVDLDGDGRLDIVTTAVNGNIRAWRNLGARQFAPTPLPGVQSYAYSLDWGDVDRDGDLDLLAASYDASLEKQSSTYKNSHKTGVSLYTVQAGQFIETRLAGVAQALAVQLADLNDDGRLDILVGNDFDLRDYVWLAGDEGWQAAEPFATTTMSTMSFSRGDINNDGHWELFAADMHPYSQAAEVMNQWQPVMAAMVHPLAAGDPQHMANVLQARQADGSYENSAAQSGLAATGWSWSGKFADLDQDGFLDLYVVNGMQALDNFSHLPNDELVEENQALRNDGQGHFSPAPQWGLNSKLGGRSMSMADLDGDGDLDIVVNNLQAPAQIFENQLCQGASLLVDLAWPASLNRYAVGARLALHTSSGIYRREVRVTSGYLSADPSQIHFGFPAGSRLQRLEIIWPDGQVSTVEPVGPGTRIRVERT